MTAVRSPCDYCRRLPCTCGMGDARPLTKTPKWTRLDDASLAIRVLAPLALAGVGGWFIGHGEWESAWRVGVLCVLMLIHNVAYSILDELKRKRP